MDLNLFKRESADGKMPASGMKLAQPGLAIMLLFAFFAFFLVLTPVLTSLIGRVCPREESAIRLAMLVQDILVFILPAVATAMLCSRLPARLLGVEKWPSLSEIVLSTGILIFSIPAMNCIVEWNQGWHLPESMSHIEDVFRNMEMAAQSVTDSLMAGASIGSLIVSILIIGVLAGFSEELFFRGGMQRIFMCTNLNGHTAVWLVAFLFSAFHFQFFGFVPRLLLGAYFGYLLWWSRSLWLPMMLHILNNSLVVYFTWRKTNSDDSGLNPDTIGTDLSSVTDVSMVIASVAVTAGLLWMLYRVCRNHRN